MTHKKYDKFCHNSHFHLIRFTQLNYPNSIIIIPIQKLNTHYKIITSQQPPKTSLTAKCIDKLF